MSEMAEKWESVAETVNWGTQMLIRSCKRVRIQSERVSVVCGTHGLEFEMDVRQIRVRIVHVRASP
jgi:hypothetical protein